MCNLYTRNHLWNLWNHNPIGSRDYPPINVKPTDILELENTCNLFSPRRVPGYDNISMRVIKHLFHLISAPLVNIIKTFL